MAETHRVIVTGNNAAGKSIVLEDVQVGMNGPGNLISGKPRLGRHRQMVRPGARP
jgi:hypothetical protein